MAAYILLSIFIIFLIFSRICLKAKKYYKRLNFISFIVLNIFTVIWFIIQYNFAYKEYGVAELEAPISIIPNIVLSIIGVAILCIVYNFLYVILNLSSERT